MKGHLCFHWPIRARVVLPTCGQTASKLALHGLCGLCGASQHLSDCACCCQSLTVLSPGDEYDCHERHVPETGNTNCVCGILLRPVFNAGPGGRTISDGIP